jgi:predicted alpha/beta hydrolase family esterase
VRYALLPTSVSRVNNPASEGEIVMSTLDARRVRFAGAHVSVVRELAGMVTAALLQPAAAHEPSGGALRLLAGEPTSPGRVTFRTPIVLVPGYGGNRMNWRALERQLRAAGFVNLHAMAYNPLTADLPSIAARLKAHCEEAMSGSGVDRVHLIGHSLGGIVVRYAVSRLGLSTSATSVVTIAAPHRGTSVARLGRGPAAAAVRRGSPLLAELAAPPPDAVRWVAYYSNLDVVVPPRSARLVEPTLWTRNILIPDEGHLSILRSPTLLNSVAAELAAAEHRWASRREFLDSRLSLAS